MKVDVPLRCECGKIRGMAKDVERSAGTRCVCYCGDCQAFARFLGRQGIVDQWGGTDIWQMSPGHLALEAEEGALACVRLSAEGMHRWYCSACKTPVANTMTAIIPFVGVVHSFMDFASTGVSRDEVLGPGHPVQTATAYGEGAPVQKGSAVFSVLLRTMAMVVGRKIAGRGRVSPFFDPKTKKATAEPKVLTPDERRALAPTSSAPRPSS